MKKLFPRYVEIVTGLSPRDTRLIDIETGDEIENVVEVTISANSQVMPKVVLHMEGTTFRYKGVAEYAVDEETLRHVAHANGFDIVAKK
jgi:hypothetical protein